MSDTPITEDWLREVGFCWHQFDRQPGKHWLLWLGAAVRESENCGSLMSYDDIGLELAPSFDGNWFCWFRSDSAGRYHRFIHIRHLRTRGDVIRLFEAVAGVPWAPENNLYGSARGPKEAARILAENDRLDRLLMRKGHPWADIEKDDSRGGALPEHLEAYEKAKR